MSPEPTAPLADPALFAELQARIRGLDSASLRRIFHEQGEFIVIDDFLPRNLLQRLIDGLPALAQAVHRNYIPRHKKGGSVSRFDLDRLEPAFGALYRDVSLNVLFEALTKVELHHCAPDDPHTYALYYYTEPGDHIGYHYDTSYYRGRRYTVLIGLVDESSSCLEYQLHRNSADREPVAARLRLEPGAMVLFNGDRLYHRITPLGQGERRIVLTLEYVTDPRMNPFLRFVSNMKDAIAYFGMRQVFARRSPGAK
jgi:hypothetical protein